VCTLIKIDLEQLTPLVPSQTTIIINCLPLSLFASPSLEAALAPAPTSHGPPCISLLVFCLLPVISLILRVVLFLRSAIMAVLSDLDFKPSPAFLDQVKSHFRVIVSPISSTLVFLLVASFSRSTIRFDVDSMNLILQSCLREQRRILMFVGSRIGPSISRFLASKWVS
jgi:hypothetical protein